MVLFHAGIPDQNRQITYQSNGFRGTRGQSRPENPQSSLAELLQAELLKAVSQANRFLTEHAEVMSDNSRPPLFNDRARRELYEHRVLVLDGVLDDDNGTLLATQMLALAAEDSSSDIALWIHSPGGSVPAMLAIRDIMKLVPNTVSTLVLGVAYSAGQFLLSAGTKGTRRALPHSRILMHQGSAGIGGSAIEVELQAGDLRHTRDTVLGLISADTGQPIKKIFNDSLHDHWYTAREAIEYGFIDAIVETFEGIMPRRQQPTGFGSTRMEESR